MKGICEYIFLIVIVSFKRVHLKAQDEELCCSKCEISKAAHQVRSGAEHSELSKNFLVQQENVKSKNGLEGEHSATRNRFEFGTGKAAKTRKKKHVEEKYKQSSANRSNSVVNTETEKLPKVSHNEDLAKREYKSDLINRGTEEQRVQNYTYIDATTESELLIIPMENKSDNESLDDCTDTTSTSKIRNIATETERTDEKTVKPSADELDASHVISNINTEDSSKSDKDSASTTSIGTPYQEFLDRTTYLIIKLRAIEDGLYGFIDVVSEYSVFCINWTTDKIKKCCNFFIDYCIGLLFILVSYIVQYFFISLVWLLANILSVFMWISAFLLTVVIVYPITFLSYLCELIIKFLIYPIDFVIVLILSVALLMFLMLFTILIIQERLKNR